MLDCKYFVNNFTNTPVNKAVITVPSFVPTIEPLKIKFSLYNYLFQQTIQATYPNL